MSNALIFRKHDGKNISSKKKSTLFYALECMVAFLIELENRNSTISKSERLMAVHLGVYSAARLCDQVEYFLQTYSKTLNCPGKRNRKRKKLFDSKFFIFVLVFSLAVLQRLILLSK